MQTISPLRYPGGKTIIRNRIKKIIEANGPVNRFIELYAGGAGLGLWLLESGHINQLVINDADQFIYSFWHSLLNQPEELIQKIEKTPITVQEWERQRRLILEKDSSNSKSSLDIGFAALFLNRCNRSGIIRGDVGPIGGKGQEGKWKIDVRFNKERIIEKIKHIVKYKDKIVLYGMDAIVLMEKFTRDEKLEKSSLFYLDPPYYRNGDNLYRTFYQLEDHLRLLEYLESIDNIKWILSYDDSEFINNLYESFNIFVLRINHHAHKVKNGTELIITPSTIKWPDNDEND